MIIRLTGLVNSIKPLQTIIIAAMGVITLWLPLKLLLQNNENIKGILSHSTCFIDKYGEMRHHQLHLKSGAFFSMTSRYKCSIYKDLNEGDSILLEVKGGTIVTLTDQYGVKLISSSDSQEVNERVIIGFPFIALFAFFMVWKRLKSESTK